MKFRKKPVEIEAWQYKGEIVKGVCACVESSNLHLHTMHKGQTVDLEDGDWIIPEPDGEHFYPCKPNEFEARYDKITEFGYSPVVAMAKGIPTESIIEEGEGE